MRTITIFSVCAVLLLGGCTNKLEDSIQDQLENIAKEFLGCWEPPFYPEESLALFTQSEDFHLIIDGLEISNYQDWAKGVPDFMAHEKNKYQSYSHEIIYMESVVLSPHSGVVTLVYIWDSVTKDGVHERTPGASTLTCREEDSVWKIVHYHGSHGEPEIMD